MVSLMALGMEVREALADPRYMCDFLGLLLSDDEVDDDAVLGVDRERCLRPEAWCWRCGRRCPSSAGSSSMASIIR